ncbi:MAG TPA: hypothetical protein VEV38_08740 [Candidatus Eremiobacteraceae bacterium]|nr:hypothetical protein [Candidatus Eremiobacteraceae bacterium]
MDTHEIGQPSDSSPGVVADRAITIAAAYWRQIAVLIALTFIPQAVLQYNVATAWADQYGQTTPAGMAHANLADAGATSSQESGLDTGNWNIANIAHDALLFIASGLIAVYVSQWMGKRRVGLPEVLSRLSDRWTVVALCATASTLAMFALREGFGYVAAWIFNRSVQDPNFFLRFEYIQPAWGFAISFTELLALSLGIGVTATAILDEGTVIGSILEGIAVMLNRQTCLRTALFTAAFVVLFYFADRAEIVSTMALNATHAALIDTVIYILI